MIDVYDFKTDSWESIKLQQTSRLYAEDGYTLRYAHLSGLQLFRKKHDVFLAVGPEFDAYDFFNTEKIGVGFTLRIKFHSKK